MDGPFLSCDDFLVYATHHNDEWRLVLQNFDTRKSIIIPKGRWAAFIAVCPDIDRAIEDKFTNFRISFGDNFYAIVNSGSPSVVLRNENEVVTKEIELGAYYWDKLMRYLPQLMPEVPELFVDFLPSTMRQTHVVKPRGRLTIIIIFSR